MAKLTDLWKKGQTIPLASSIPEGGIAIDVVGKRFYSKTNTGDIFSVANEEDIDTKVDKAGDTMTGQLRILDTNPRFYVQDENATTYVSLDGSATGGFVYRLRDAIDDSSIANIMSFNPDTGKPTMYLVPACNEPPIVDSDLTRKDYVDGLFINFYDKSEYIDESTGSSDAAKPILLNGDGFIDPSMLDTSTFYPVGPYDPSDSANPTGEYPDASAESPGAFWYVSELIAPDGNEPTNGKDYYVFKTDPSYAGTGTEIDSLLGKRIYEGDFMVWASSGWGIMSGRMNPTLYYMLDGSSAITDAFAGGGQQFKDAADGVDAQDLVTKAQLDTKVDANHNHDDLYYTEAESDNRFVNAVGDVMTGDLKLGDGVNSSDMEIRATPTEHARFRFRREDASVGSQFLFHNDTDDLNIFLYESDGSTVANKFIIEKDGNVSTLATVPSEDRHLARKDYVDNTILSAEDIGYTYARIPDTNPSFNIIPGYTINDNAKYRVEMYIDDNEYYILNFSFEILDGVIYDNKGVMLHHNNSTAVGIGAMVGVYDVDKIYIYFSLDNLININVKMYSSLVDNMSKPIDIELTLDPIVPELLPVPAAIDMVFYDLYGSAYAVQDKLDIHTADLNNPHVVTAIQVDALPITGGTLTGDLTIGNGSAGYSLKIRGLSSYSSMVKFYSSDDTLKAMIVSSENTSEFSISTTNDGITSLSSLTIGLDGNCRLKDSAIAPVNSNDITHKTYVDTKLPKSGGTITGDLAVSGYINDAKFYKDTADGIFIDGEDGAFLRILQDGTAQCFDATVTLPSPKSYTPKKYVDELVTNVNFIGEVKLYYGDISKLRPVWHICDGTKGTPDLVEQFLRGANDEEIPYIMYIGGSNE